MALDHKFAVQVGGEELMTTYDQIKDLYNKIGSTIVRFVTRKIDQAYKKYLGR